MAQLPGLRALCNFLAKTPDSSQLNHYWGLQNDFFFPKSNRLYDALEQYARLRPNGSSASEFSEIDALLKKHQVYNPKRLVKYSYKVADSLLFDLSQFACGSSLKAGYACYVLGCLYDHLQTSAFPTFDVKQSNLLAAYFYGKALEKNYITDDSKKAYADACAHLGWFDTAYYWYSTFGGKYYLATVYLAHLIRYCQERGVAFPQTQNNLVYFEETPQARELEAMLINVHHSDLSLKSGLEILEGWVPPRVYELNDLLDKKERQLLRRRRWSRSMWWILFLLVSICAAPGYLHGNGEGLQGLSYKLFMATYVPFGNVFTEGMTFAERLVSNLEGSARTTIAGAGLVGHAVMTLIWTTFLKFFVRKKHAKRYGAFKQKLYNECQFEAIVAQVEAMQSASKPDEYENLNRLATAWHDALVSRASRVNIPQSRDRAKTMLFSTASEALLCDYDAFVNAFKMIPHRNDQYILPWSGDELALEYTSVGEYYELSFENYFTKMFESSAMLCRAWGLDDSWEQSQISTLSDMVSQVKYNRAAALEAEQEEARRALFAKDNDPGPSLGQIIGEELNRAGNLFSYGVSATNDEIIDALESSGKISGTEADKARYSPWGLGALDRDDL